MNNLVAYPLSLYRKAETVDAAENAFRREAAAAHPRRNAAIRAPGSDQATNRRRYEGELVDARANAAKSLKSERETAELLLSHRPCCLSTQDVEGYHRADPGRLCHAGDVDCHCGATGRSLCIEVSI